MKIYLKPDYRFVELSCLTAAHKKKKLQSFISDAIAAVLLHIYIEINCNI